MTYRYYYAAKWSRGYKEPQRPLSLEKALESHESGKWYTVLVGDLQRPAAFIEVVGENRYVGVNFLDDQLRDYLIYNFQRDATGRLFMSAGDYRTYEGVSDELVMVEQYRFKRDGFVTITRTDLKSNACEVGSKTIDVSPNYDSWPEFGSYDSLLVRDRDTMQS